MSAQWIEAAERVFAAWSSGDADAPESLIRPDAVLWDVASGRFEGWPAIRAFFARGLEKWAGLQLIPDEFWVNESSIAVHYVMSAVVQDPTIYGPEFVGKKWETEVMSHLRFDDAGLLVFEADFHDKGARARNLGITI